MSDPELRSGQHEYLKIIGSPSQTVQKPQFIAVWRPSVRSGSRSLSDMAQPRVKVCQRPAGEAVLEHQQARRCGRRGYAELTSQLGQGEGPSGCSAPFAAKGRMGVPSGISSGFSPE